MTPTPPSPQDRARGALLGLAVGDALGVPLVGMTREQARIKHGRVTRFLGGGLYLLPPGHVTGRVALARAAAVAAVADPPAGDDGRLAAYLGVLAQEPPGLGEMTRASLERIRDGASPAAAARAAADSLERHAAGIGPALRTLPLALLDLADDDAYARRVLADAAWTHADPRAGAAALALGLWVRAHLAGEADAAAALEQVREKMADRIELPDVLPAPAAVRTLPVRPTAFAPDVLHAVVRHVLAADTPGAAIAGAANEAGAAAALGAATGAVAGACHGAARLPEAWTSLVEAGRTWQRLADRLVPPS